MSYLIVYDIRRLDNQMRLWVNRQLHKMEASKLQHSVWESNEFEGLRGLATSIKSRGGKALVLKKRIVYE
jgi:CRISPR/Cas system-associated endoribonuclease Cas2